MASVDADLLIPELGQQFEQSVEHARVEVCEALPI
ncbi:hypothetical protein SBA2_40072 [Acidobacteriia bacterium SbA2]|nr:hypothetical protein SBA2_40072 [Acidobacteriia bacterium SbA2]